MLSYWQKTSLGGQNYYPAAPKLIPSLYHEKNYVIHHRNLQSLRMQLKCFCYYYWYYYFDYDNYFYNHFVVALYDLYLFFRQVFLLFLYIIYFCSFLDSSLLVLYTATMITA